MPCREWWRFRFRISRAFPAQLKLRHPGSPPEASPANTTERKYDFLPQPYSKVHDGLRVSLACTKEIQAGLQLLAVAPAQPKPGSILKQDIVFTSFVQLEAANAIEPHDGRTVNSAEGD